MNDIEVLKARVLCISGDNCGVCPYNYGVDDCRADDRAERTALLHAIALMEKEEKFRWHDLRKDPEDLPEELTIVQVTWINNDQEPYYADIKGKPFSDSVCVIKNGNWYWWTPTIIDLLLEYGTEVMRSDIIDKAISIIRWRYIDPGEEEESEKNEN